MNVYCGSVPSTYCAASYTAFMYGSVDVGAPRPRRAGGGGGGGAGAFLTSPSPSAATGRGGGAAAACGPRRGGSVQYFSMLLTSCGYLSCSASISVFSVSISAFHFSTRASDPTTVDASFVS